MTLSCNAAVLLFQCGQCTCPNLPLWAFGLDHDGGIDFFNETSPCSPLSSAPLAQNKLASYAKFCAIWDLSSHEVCYKIKKYIYYCIIIIAIITINAVEVGSKAVLKLCNLVNANVFPKDERQNIE